MTETTYRPTKAQLEAATLLVGPARNILLYGGARSGKTFKVLDYLCTVAKLFPNSRQLVVRRTLLSARQSVAMDTMEKVLKHCHSDERVHYNKSDYFFQFENGSEIWIGGLDGSGDEERNRVDKILGKGYCNIFFNEASELQWAAVGTAKSRNALKVRGLVNKLIYDCNPPSKRHWIYRQFVEKIDPATRIPLSDPDNYAMLRMNPDDNRENLPETYFSDILSGFSGRTRQRFVIGEFSDDNENALWKRTMIDPYRLRNAPENMERIVVAVDPAVTNREGSDATGIITAGLKNGRYYVLDDSTMKGSPNEWAARVAAVYGDWKADRVVVETNNGGDLVLQLLRNTQRNLPITKIHARRGKILRAEPIAGIYEQGRVHHVGEFCELEDQMCGFTGSANEDSPDNLDALVYAVTELSGGSQGTISQMSHHIPGLL